MTLDDDEEDLLIEENEIPVDVIANSYIDKSNFSIKALERIEDIVRENALGDDFFEAVLIFCKEIDVEVDFFYKKAEPIILSKLKESAIKSRKIQQRYYDNKSQLKKFFGK